MLQSHKRETFAISYRSCIERAGIEISLQGDFVSGDAASLRRVRRPVQPDDVVPDLREPPDRVMGPLGEDGLKHRDVHLNTGNTGKGTVAVPLGRPAVPG